MGHILRMPRALMGALLALLLCIGGITFSSKTERAYADPGTAKDISGLVTVNKVEMYVGGVLYISNGTIIDPSIELKVGTSVEFKVHWNIPSDKMAGINEDDWFEILLPGDYFTIISSPSPMPITSGAPGNAVIGEMSIITPVGDAPRFKVVLNDEGADANSLDNGWLKANGRASVEKDGSETITIGDITLPGFPVTEPNDPGGNTGVVTHPWNNPKPVSKGGFQTNSTNKATWKVGVNEDLYADLYNTGSYTPRNNIVITDTLETGLVFSSIQFSTAYYYPHIDPVTSAVSMSSSLACEIELPTGSIPEIVELPNEEYADFYDRVLAESGPAYGVYQNKDLVISLKNIPGTLTMSLTLDELKARAAADLGSGKISQEQHDAYVDVYASKVYGNSQTAALVGARITIGTTVYGDSRDVSNEVNMTWGNSESANASTTFEYSAMAGGANTGLPGSVVIRKYDSATSDLLDGATFKLQKRNVSGVYEDYMPRDGIAERTTVNGIATFTNLHYGTYRVIETAPLSGYLDEAVYPNGNTFTIDASSLAAVYIDAFNIKPDFSATKTVSNDIDFAPGEFTFEIQTKAGTAVAYGAASVTQNDTATPIVFYSNQERTVPISSWKTVFTLGETYRLVEVGGGAKFATSYSGGSGAGGNEFVATFTHDAPTISLTVLNTRTPVPPVPEKPEKPEKPENPEKPEKPGEPDLPKDPREPEEPEEPETPQKVENPKTPTKPQSVTPKTSDNGMITFILTSLAISLFIITISLRRYRRKA